MKKPNNLHTHTTEDVAKTEHIGAKTKPFSENVGSAWVKPMGCSCGTNMRVSAGQIQEHDIKDDSRVLEVYSRHAY